MTRPSSPRDKTPSAQTDRLAAAALLAALVVIRALVIARGHQLDIDEADTALKVAKPVAALIEDLTRDGHPPLYFFLLKGWTTLFGRTEAALRSLSVLFSAGTLLVLLAATRRLFGRTAALFAGILFVLSPVEIFHATEGRMYTLLPLEAIAAFALTARLVSGDDERSARPPSSQGKGARGAGVASGGSPSRGAGGASRRGDVARGGGAPAQARRAESLRNSAAALLAVLVAGLYTHNYGLFLPVAVAVATLPLAARVARTSGAAAAARSVAWPLAAAAFACVLYLPWLPVLQEQRASKAHLWLVDFFDHLPPILAIPRSLAALAGTGPFPPITPVLRPAAPLAGVMAPLGALLLAAGIVSALSRGASSPPGDGAGPPDARRAAAIFPLALLGGPWLVSVTVKVIYLVGRYDVVALPFVMMLFGAGASALSARRRALLAAPVLFLIAPLPGVGALLDQPRGGDVVEQVRALASQPATRAVITTQLSGSRFRYYLARLGRPDVIVRSFPASTDLHPGWLESPDPKDPRTAAEADALARSFEASLKRGEFLWVTLYDEDKTKDLLVHALAMRFAADAAQTRLDMGLIAVTPP